MKRIFAHLFAGLVMTLPLLTSTAMAAENKPAAFDVSKRIVYRIPGMDQVTVTHDIEYRNDSGASLKMNVYSPLTLSSDARLPVVFFVHGGPIPTEMLAPTEWGIYKSYGELIAASGFIGVTFNHRLHSMNDYPRSQSDVLAAMQYVRAHAAQLHADADHVALWIFSAGGPHLSWVLRDPPAGLRCVVTFYSLLDMRLLAPANAKPETVAALERLSAAVQIKDHGQSLPILVARAGLDAPQINQGIDRFVAEAFIANRTIEVINHPQGQHSFDALDDNARSKEIIARAVAFLRTHLQ